MKYDISWSFYDNVYKVIDNDQNILKEFRFIEDAKNYIRNLLGYEDLKCVLCEASIDSDDNDSEYFDLISHKPSGEKLCFHCSEEQAQIFDHFS